MLKCDLPRVPDCNNNICTCPTDGDYWWSEIEGCYPFCASSYDFNELRRECQKVWGLVFDVRFGSFASAIELFPSGIIVSTSSVKSYNEDPDGSPIPVRFRGVYYGHPNNPAYHLITGCQAEPLILNPNMTIKLWFKPAPFEEDLVGRRLEDVDTYTLLYNQDCTLSLEISLTQVIFKTTMTNEVINTV